MNWLQMLNVTVDLSRPLRRLLEKFLPQNSDSLKNGCGDLDPSPHFIDQYVIADPATC